MLSKVNIFVQERQILKIQKELMPGSQGQRFSPNIVVQDSGQRDFRPIIPCSVRSLVLSSSQSLKINLPEVSAELKKRECLSQKH